MINKEKNQSITITLPKDVVSALDEVVNVNKEQNKLTRSKVICLAFVKLINDLASNKEEN